MDNSRKVNLEPTHHFFSFLLRFWPHCISATTAYVCLFTAADQLAVEISQVGSVPPSPQNHNLPLGACTICIVALLLMDASPNIRKKECRQSPIHCTYSGMSSPSYQWLTSLALAMARSNVGMVHWWWHRPWPSRTSRNVTPQSRMHWRRWPTATDANAQSTPQRWMNV